jgi:hypothetical protein
MKPVAPSSEPVCSHGDDPTGSGYFSILKRGVIGVYHHVSRLVAMTLNALNAHCRMKTPQLSDLRASALNH